jgi:hypothetical protein
MYSMLQQCYICTFLTAHRRFPKIDHTLGHKASFNKHKIEISPCILSDHNSVRLEINKKTAENIQTIAG